MDFLRDPIWQFIGVISSVILGIASLVVATKALPKAGKSKRRNLSYTRSAQILNDVLFYLFLLFNIFGSIASLVLILQSWWAIFFGCHLECCVKESRK
jgi:hypothetical protein